MKMKFNLQFIFLTLLITQTLAQETVKTSLFQYFSKLDQIFYVYDLLPQTTNDSKVYEQELEECEELQVCNVLHKQYWLPPLVHRLCKCPGDQKCSTSQSTTEKYNIRLNGRATMKICQRASSLRKCDESEPGVVVTVTGEEKKTRKAVVQCSCDWPNYWMLGDYEQNATYIRSGYFCSELKKCEIEGFCGHIRPDTQELYQTCTCPRGSLCNDSGAETRHASELLYDGPVKKAICLKIHTD